MIENITFSLRGYMPLFIMLKFLRNLTVAGVLSHLGVLVWPSGLDLIFPIKCITIVMNFLNDVYDVTHSMIRPSKEGLFYCPKFSQISIFVYYFSQMNILELERFTIFTDFSSAKIACAICCFKL